MPMVAETIKGDQLLGITYFRIRRGVLQPMASAASRYWFSRVCITVPRSSRTLEGMVPTEIAIMVLSMPTPRAAEMIMVKRIDGIAWMMSSERMTSVS